MTAEQSGRKPTFEDVLALPRLLARKVPKEYEDYNGHMNVTGYLRLHDEAALPFMDMVGMDSDYPTSRQLSVFDLEHHIVYVEEVMVGASIAIHARTFARTNKVVHGQWYLLDLDKRRLANTLEFLTAHVSLEARRTVNFPNDVASGLDAQIAASDGLEWDPLISGALALRT